MMITLLRLLIAASGASPAPEAVPVALVYLSSGTPVLQPRGQASRTIHGVARVADGASLDVPAAGRLRIAFLDGRRYELRGPARARVTSRGLQETSGTVEVLVAVPPLPRLAPVRDDVGDRIAAIRLRSGAIRILTPTPGGAVLAGSPVTLSFAAVDGASRYAVDVRAADGRSLAALGATSTTVPLPAGLLAPGGRYTWSVDAEDVSGARHRGLGDFWTLDEGTVSARVRLREAAGADDRALLEAVDRELGLTPSELDAHVADKR